MFVFLASFIIFILWLSYELKKHDKLEKDSLETFWSREEEANRTRRQPLDDLVYVTVPFDFIPKSLLDEDDTVKDCLDTLQNLADAKIVNLTGLSNTDLKLRYGAANLTVLSEYDENYTLYARTIYRLACAYYENGYESNARILLEKAVESGTDINGNYQLLAEIYQKHGETDKIRRLLSSASALRTPSGKTITRHLEDFLEESDHKS